MNEITKKFAALTAEQSKALAEAMNSDYNKPSVSDDTETTDTLKEQIKTEQE